MSDPHLRDCPFDGGEAEFVTGHDPYPDVGFAPDPKYVSCKTCGASTRAEKFLSKEELAELWNKRV